jgi:cellulose synthase/poly-beta-1,6-N-acetylglucosamine synthase-like glycosyltransferase
MNRVVITFDKSGCFSVASDQEIEVFIVDDNAPNDRVYQMVADHGVELVAAQLRGDPVGCANDEQFGKLAPSRPKFTVIDGGE